MFSISAHWWNSFVEFSPFAASLFKRSSFWKKIFNFQVLLTKNLAYIVHQLSYFLETLSFSDSSPLRKRSSDGEELVVAIPADRRDADKQWTDSRDSIHSGRWTRRQCLSRYPLRTAPSWRVAIQGWGNFRLKPYLRQNLYHVNRLQHFEIIIFSLYFA